MSDMRSIAVCQDSCVGHRRGNEISRLVYDGARDTAVMAGQRKGSEPPASRRGVGGFGYRNAVGTAPSCFPLLGGPGALGMAVETVGKYNAGSGQQVDCRYDAELNRE